MLVSRAAHGPGGTLRSIEMTSARAQHTTPTMARPGRPPLAARRAGKPLWLLLAEMSPKEICGLVDFQYLIDALTPDEAAELLERGAAGREGRIEALRRDGYLAHSTGPGWLGYSNEQLAGLCAQAVDEGFTQVKIKVGAAPSEDVRRCQVAREVIGDNEVRHGWIGRLVSARRAVGDRVILKSSPARMRSWPDRHRLLGKEGLMPNPRNRRSVIVTGASQGIGRGIALRLAKDGLDITVNDLPSSESSLTGLIQEIESQGVVCKAATGDVSRRDDVDRIVTDHVTNFGGLDVIVANAGIAITAEFVDTTLDDLQRTLAINVGGVFNCYKAASKVMIEQGRGGRLIAAGSVSAHRGGHWQSAYVASKFAVRGLTQTVATELGQYGITANLYSPGVVQTSMWDSIDEVVTGREGKPRGAQLAKMLPNIPLGRVSEPADVAAVVSFLASEDSAYVTGQSIVVDGGMYFV